MRAGQPAPVRLLAGSGARRPGSLPGSGHGKLLVNVLFMGLTTTARLLTNVVLFVLLARAWPVDQFGEFVYWFTAATIVALIVDFGFSQSLLRDIGRDRDRAGDFVREVSLAKAVLAGLVGIGALAAFAVGAWDMHTTMLFLMLLAGAMLATFGESLNATWRGVGNFAEETRVVVLSSVVLFGVVAVSLALGAGPLQVAGGMLLARLAYVAISWPVLRALPAPGFTPSLARSLRLIRDYRFFGIDAFLTNLYSSVDTLLVGHLLGSGAVGIYQAGMRLVQGANVVAPMLANVFMAPIAGAHADHARLVTLVRQLYLTMLVVGGATALAFIYLATPLVHLLYGERYGELAALMPWLGVLLLIRYVAAAHGVVLAGLGHQATRAYAIVACLALLAVLAALLVPPLGLTGMAFAVLASTVALHALYLLRLVHERMPLGLGARNALLTFMLAALVAAGLLAGR